MTEFEQARIFDIEAARDAKAEAMARVEEHADEGWNDAAYAVVCDIARRAPEFTTDRVWYELRRADVPDPHEPKALGPVMLRAARAGVIEKTDRVHQSISATNHARPLAVWRSLA